LVFGGGSIDYFSTSPAVTNRLFTIGDSSGNSATIESDSVSPADTLSFTSTGPIALVNAAPHTLQLNAANTGLNLFAPSIGDQSAANPTNLVKDENGTWLLRGANTYSGGTDIRAGILNVDADTELGTPPASPATNITFGEAGEVYSNPPSPTLQFAANMTLNANRSTVLESGLTGTFDTQSFNVAYGGAISGAGSFAKQGGGTLTLSGAETYTGGTTVSAGTLLVANTSGSATGTNSVSVNSGAMLAGSTSPGQGFINGAVTVNSGGAISGNNGATLTLSGGLTLASGATNSAFNLTASPSANPLIPTSGGAGGNSLIVNGADAVTVTGTPSVGIYDLLGFVGTAPSVGSFALAAAPAGKSYMINITSNQVDLQVGSIDESGSGSFNGTVLSSSVANGGSYAGISSTTASMVSDSPNPGIEGTTATILTGTNHQGSALTLRMTWRSRTLSETPANDGINGNGFVNGTPTSPPLAGLPLISDVVNLFGMAAGSTGTNVAPVQTDPFVFQMSFNPATLKAEGATNADMATSGNLYLASLIPVNGVSDWENTIDANFAVAGATTTTIVDGVTLDIGDSVTSNNFARPFIGTFAQWEADNPLFNSTDIADYLGVWGVDPDTLGSGEYNAWAIVNHNSDFAVVPEPSSLILAGIGVAGVFVVASKRRARAPNTNSMSAIPCRPTASAA
jgi:autotransporter-associated beta strand protein